MEWSWFTPPRAGAAAAPSPGPLTKLATVAATSDPNKSLGHGLIVASCDQRPGCFSLTAEIERRHPGRLLVKDGVQTSEETSCMARSTSVILMASFIVVGFATTPSMAAGDAAAKGKSCRMEQQCRWENFKKICTWVKVCR
jgi:hypothetical protein